MWFQSDSFYIWIILVEGRWQDLDPEWGKREEDNSCKCHRRGQGLTSLKLPVGGTEGRECWHFTRLQHKDDTHTSTWIYLMQLLSLSLSHTETCLATYVNTDSCVEQWFFWWYCRRKDHYYYIIKALITTDGQIWWRDDCCVSWRQESEECKS